MLSLLSFYARIVVGHLFGEVMGGLLLRGLIISLLLPITSLRCVQGFADLGVELISLRFGRGGRRGWRGGGSASALDVGALIRAHAEWQRTWQTYPQRNEQVRAQVFEK